jgi:hypothetical protein
MHCDLVLVRSSELGDLARGIEPSLGGELIQLSKKAVSNTICLFDSLVLERAGTSSLHSKNLCRLYL